MKKLLRLLPSICCVFLLASCQKRNAENIDHGNSDHNDYTKYSSSSGITINDPEPVYPNSTEIDSSKIETELYQPVTTKSDIISIKITGSNTPNNTLYYFTFTALEKENNSEWIRIPVTDSIAQTINEDPNYFWSFCSREDESEQMWTTSTLYISDLAESIQKGSYRTVTFFPDRNVYTYFEITE